MHALLLAAALFAVEPGDVVVSADSELAFEGLPATTIAVRTPGGNFKGSLYTTGVIFALDPAGQAYVLEGNKVQLFDVTTQHVRDVTLPERAHAIGVDAGGFAYVLGESATLYVLTPGGAIQRTLTLPHLLTPVQGSSLDVTPDGCTVVYIGYLASANVYNVCSQSEVPRLVPPDRFDAVRALRDGGFAGAIGGRIRFYDAIGRVARDIPSPVVPPILAITFDADPEFMWVANKELLVKTRIADGMNAAHMNAHNPHALAVVGETRPSAIPTGRRRVARH